MKILKCLAGAAIILSVVAVATLAPPIAPNSEWWEACPPDPTCATQYPPQPTFTPRPTYTAAPTPTCHPTTTCPPNPSPTSYPTATFYPTATTYPTQPANRPTQTPTTRVGIVHGSGDFETGDLTGFYASGNTPEIVSDGHPVRAGSHSMRAYLHRYESGCSYRTMALPQPDDQGSPGHQSEFVFNIGDEYWIGFSVYVQSDLVSDPPGLTDVIFQCQPKPDPGENYMPCLALVIDTLEENGELTNYWRIWRRWEPRASTSGYQYSEWFQMVLPMDPADVGGWTDWVFHIIWDYHNDGDGLLQVWRNGVEVLNVSGGNCRNDQRGPYSSFGVYKWGYDDPYEYNSEWRLLYFDEFRIGNANATYEDVAPNGGH